MVRPDERHARVGPGHSGMSVFFFFNDTATTEIYTLSLHDALPICRRALGATARRRRAVPLGAPAARVRAAGRGGTRTRDRDRKSTRLNSSHLVISYAVFCLKKKKKKEDVRVGPQACSTRSTESEAD